MRFDYISSAEGDFEFDRAFFLACLRVKLLPSIEFLISSKCFILQCGFADQCRSRLSVRLKLKAQLRQI